MVTEESGQIDDAIWSGNIQTPVPVGESWQLTLHVQMFFRGWYDVPKMLRLLFCLALGLCIG